MYYKNIGNKNMKFKFLAIALVLTLVSVSFGGASNINQSSTDKQLDLMVEGALKWLINKSIITENGVQWPCSENDNESYTSLYEGTPGVCLLFLKAYKITGNESYLYYAQGGMKWLMSMAVEENGGYKWPDKENSTSFIYYTGLYEGAAGIGSTFLDFYQTLDNATYLKYGEGAARWIVNTGIIENSPRFGTTCKWPYAQGISSYSFDIISGAAGIGLFLLKIYDVTKNETYLQYAKYAGNWLMKSAINLGNAYTWNLRSLPSGFFITSGFAHGTSGIGNFFAELYKTSKESIYLKYAEGAARWIMRDSVYDFRSNGIKWRSVYRNDQMRNILIFDSGWCYGPTGICEFFIDLYKITHNQKYLRYSELGANWLMSIAISNGTGYLWPRDSTRFRKGTANSADVTICHGVAGIGELFLDMYNVTKKPAYLTYANGAAEWLKQVAIKDNDGGYKWATYGECYTGHYKGASGIALFLIKAGE